MNIPNCPGCCAQRLRCNGGRIWDEFAGNWFDEILQLDMENLMGELVDQLNCEFKDTIHM